MERTTSSRYGIDTVKVLDMGFMAKLALFWLYLTNRREYESFWKVYRTKHRINKSDDFR